MNETKLSQEVLSILLKEGHIEGTREFLRDFKGSLPFPDTVFNPPLLEGDSFPAQRGDMVRVKSHHRQDLNGRLGVLLGQEKGTFFNWKVLFDDEIVTVNEGNLELVA